MTDLLALMTSRGFSPRKISTNNGGEYSSSCPVCGDGGKGRLSDRFHIWPQRETDGLGSGRFWCRQCGISGDSIAFLQKVERLSFPDACSSLGITLTRKQGAKSSRYQRPPAAPRQQEPWCPKVYPEPGALWQEKAGNLLEDCRKRLASMPEAIAWLEKRGITRAMMDDYRLGFNQSRRDGDRYRPRSSWGLPAKTGQGKDKKLWIPRGWIIPSFNQDGGLVQLRIRRMDEDIERFGGNIKYLPVDGSSSATMVLHANAEVFVCVESGFDAILLAGTMSGKIGAVTSWNSSARPDRRADQLLQRASLILGGLDYDHGGDREQAWWSAQYSSYSRLPALPGGAKDPGDAYAQGVDLRAWVVSGLGRGLQIKLGFLPQKKHAVQAAPTYRAVGTDPEPVVDRQDVVEVDLTNGTTIYLTDNQQRWHELTAQGKPVFSHNEMARLKEATSTMGPEERLAAAMQAIEAKQLFGGYIRRGESF